MKSETQTRRSAHDGRGERPFARRWTIAWLLGAGVLVNYIDRVNLSVSQAALHEAFGISAITFGYLLSAYSWTYALLQLPSGILLDRFGVRKIGCLSTLVWSIASFGAAAATGLGTLFASRFLLGVGEAPTFPANAKAIGYWFPDRERGLPTAIFDSAAKFASAIGVPVIGILLLKFGWRWSFAFTGAVSFAYFVAFWVVYREEPAADVDKGIPRPAGDVSDEPCLSETSVVGKTIHRSARDISSDAAHTPPISKGAPLSYLLRQREVAGLALGFAAYNYSFYLLLTWLPSYLSIAHHLDLLHSALYTSTPWLFATFTDLLVGGWLVDAFIARGWNATRVRQVVLIGGTALGLGIFGAAGAQTTAAALFWISLSLGGLAAAAPVGWSIPSLIAPRNSVGSVGGIVNFCNQLSAIAAPIITGYIVHATHSFAGAFIVAAVFLLLGIGGYVFLLGNMRPIPLPNCRIEKQYDEQGRRPGIS